MKAAAFLSRREIVPGGFNFLEYVNIESACKKRRILFILNSEQFVLVERR